MDLRTLLASQEPAFGTWSQFASAEVVDIVAASGFDFTIIDTEHGFFGLETAEGLIRAADAGGIVPLLRVPENAPYMIAKALDAGAAAVVVPKIETPDQAASAVSAARFEPEGRRGACPCVRAGGHLVTDWRGFSTRSNRESGVVALLETPRGADNIESILAVPGITAILLGPFDLSVSMGYEGDFVHPSVISALERMVDSALAAGVPTIMPVFSPAMSDTSAAVLRWLDLSRGRRGFRRRRCTSGAARCVRRGVWRRMRARPRRAGRRATSSRPWSRRRR